MDLNAQLQRQRPFLLLEAKRTFNRRLEGRFDPSDVVQETLQEAYQERERFRGANSVQFAAWLLQMLRNNMIDAVRRNMRGKRAVDMEKHLGAVNRSSIGMDAILAASQTSPSENAARHEVLQEMATALEQLPPDQAEAVQLKHLHGWSLKEIAEHMERSTPAVAGLLHRGLQRLRELMEEQD
jgi:RNA polymerase sigma-70 factor (ECF subfamily)